MRTLPFEAMNTSILLAAEGEGWAQAGLQAARMYIHASERRFSRFLPHSELSRLNRSAGEWAAVSANMMELLSHSLTFYRQTGGLFDPSILPDLKRMGYDRTMDEVRTRGDVFPPASARTLRPAFSEIGFDLSRSRVRLPRGMEIDLGGIAKGWIAGKAADLLSNFTDAGAVNAGGDMLFFGERTEAQDWAVYIENPLDPSRMLSVLNVSSGAVATSSVAKRAWTQNGQARHHLIDPRTGRVRTDRLAVCHRHRAESFGCRSLCQSLVDRRFVPHGGTACPPPRSGISGRGFPREFSRLSQFTGPRLHAVERTGKVATAKSRTALMNSSYPALAEKKAAELRSMLKAVVMTMLAGALFVVLLLMIWFLKSSIGAPTAHTLAALFATDSVQAWWYITRASGLTAYFLLWLSMAWGLALATKILQPVLEHLFTFDFHEYLSLLGLGFVALHVIVLLFDKFLPFNLIQILIPFTGHVPAVVGGTGHHRLLPVPAGDRHVLHPPAHRTKSLPRHPPVQPAGLPGRDPARTVRRNRSRPWPITQDFIRRQFPRHPVPDGVLVRDESNGSTQASAGAGEEATSPHTGIFGVVSEHQARHIF